MQLTLLKYRNKLFFPGLFLLLFFCYEFAIKKTIEVWKVNENLEKKINNWNNLSNTPSFLQRQNNDLLNILSRYRADTSSLSSGIINNVALLADMQRVKLSEVPLQDPAERADKFILKQLKFQGDFFSLTRLARNLETAQEIGIIRSETWRAVDQRDGEKKGGQLILEVYIEILR